MSHYAKLVDGTVEAVLVGDPSLSDADGLQFMIDTFGGTWIQTSYNNKIRYNYAGIGYTYDVEADAFIPPKPNCNHYELTLNTINYRWECANNEHQAPPK